MIFIDFELQRLAGQVVTLHPVFIKDLSYFRAQIFGCDTTLMCCYKDLKYVMQNQAVSVEFKRQYEGQYVVAKVEAVTSDNV